MYVSIKENDREVLDILKDFTMDYRTTKKLQDGWNEMHKVGFGIISVVSKKLL